MDQIYAGMLTALDEGIGNITDTLKSTGMYDNSVMVLSNDNGGMSGSYGTARTTARLRCELGRLQLHTASLLLLFDVSLACHSDAMTRVALRGSELVWVCVQAWAAVTAAPPAAG